MHLRSDKSVEKVLLCGCRCIEIDVWDGEQHRSNFEQDGDEKKHRFRPHMPGRLGSHGPFKRFQKEGQKESDAEEVITALENKLDDLSLPTPWTSASTESRVEPRVLHGYTLTKEVPFRDVCMAVRDAAFITR